jgi:flagellar hook-basal body complex protein FliE
MAIKAYGATQKQLESLTKGEAAAPNAGTDFGKMVQSAINNTQQSTQHAEHMMTQQVQGKAELIDAVTAVASAEASLQSVIAIRDQVISAYQEIMRMPI